jgi:hypothetical protein
VKQSADVTGCGVALGAPLLLRCASKSTHFNSSHYIVIKQGRSQNTRMVSLCRPVCPQATGLKPQNSVWTNSEITWKVVKPSWFEFIVDYFTGTSEVLCVPFSILTDTDKNYVRHLHSHFRLNSTYGQLHSSAWLNCSCRQRCPSSWYGLSLYLVSACVCLESKNVTHERYACLMSPRGWRCPFVFRSSCAGSGVEKIMKSEGVENSDYIKRD